MKVILISGKAEHGKDEVAKMIKQRIGGSTVAIGDQIKFISSKYYGWDGEKGISGRTFLQVLGDQGRAIDPYFWIKCAINTFTILDTRLIVVPDVRLRNEILAFKALCNDVVTLRVVRPGHENKLTEEQRMHQTETDLDQWIFDKVIIASTLEELTSEVDKFIRDFIA